MTLETLEVTTSFSGLRGPTIPNLSSIIKETVWGGGLWLEWSAQSCTSNPSTVEFWVLRCNVLFMANICKHLRSHSTTANPAAADPVKQEGVNMRETSGWSLDQRGCSRAASVRIQLSRSTAWPPISGWGSHCTRFLSPFACLPCLFLLLRCGRRKWCVT